MSKLAYFNVMVFIIEFQKVLGAPCAFNGIDYFLYPTKNKNLLKMYFIFG